MATKAKQADRIDVRKEEFRFLSHDNRTKIHAVKWIPEGCAVRAVLQIVHGMVEYIERYDEFAVYLAKRGFLVVGHDQLGHGQSVRSSSEWGYFSKDWKKSSDILNQDIHQIYQIIHQQYPDISYFILGHSMGSYILRRYLTYYENEIDGAIICGTGTEKKISTYFGMMLTRCLGLVKGDHYCSSFVINASIDRDDRESDQEEEDYSNSWLSKNVESVREFSTAPQCQFDFTVNGYYTLFSNVNYDSHMKNVRKIRKTLPIIFLSGAEDVVGHKGKAVKEVYRQYVKAGIRDVKLKLYENDRHELLQETDREQVFEDIYHWCKKRMKAPVKNK